MDVFQHRYYRLNKMLMTLIGQWPYQNTGARHGIVAAVIFLIANQYIPISLAFVKHREHQGIVLDFAVPVLYESISVLKLADFIWNSQTTLKLLNRIRNDWLEWARDRDIGILHQYAENGRKMTIRYLVMGITASMIFVFQPTIPKIIDAFLKNNTVPGKLPYPVDYYHLDVQKYYFYIIGYSYICVSVATMVVVAHSVLLICYNQHICGIFAALGHKLERLGNNRTLLETEETRHALDKEDMVLLASCIDRHIDAFEYANLIAANYTWTFFITVVFGEILYIAIGLQILSRTDDPESTIRFIAFILAIMLYFFIECFISETLIDHSVGIYYYIQKSQWYTLSLKCQKLLQFMAMRSSLPCQLTAGKMLVMCLRTYWLSFKTTMSYLMLARSLQAL